MIAKQTTEIVKTFLFRKEMFEFFSQAEQRKAAAFLEKANGHLVQKKKRSFVIYVEYDKILLTRNNKKDILSLT